MQRDNTSSVFKLGDQLPSFSLKGTDGSQYDQDWFGDCPAKLIFFTCNHCPYVKGSEDATIAVCKEFAEQGLKAIAISSNDAEQYPDDSFEKMQEKAQTMNLPYPYLYDETQEIAKKFDAACTPEFYLFDGNNTLVYHGTVNNSPRNPEEVSEHYLQKAVSQLLNGQAIEPNFIHPLGCSIKWKK